MKEDEAETTTKDVGRYNIMPSLINKQIMNNRLHLAKLGKKLMKWTVLATGKELRKISDRIIRELHKLQEEVKDAYIALARSRYFYHDLNKIVLGNIDECPKTAAVIVNTRYKAITGAKVVIYEIEKTVDEAYPLLAMGMGGQTVADAKKRWYELLKHYIYILQLKRSFRIAEEANIAATKKMNVLGKIVIPRTQNTIAYILLELEERARDDFYRIKMVKSYKLRQASDKDGGGKVYPICGDPCIPCPEACSIRKSASTKSVKTGIPEPVCPEICQKASVKSIRIEEPPKLICPDICGLPEPKLVCPDICAKEEKPKPVCPDICKKASDIDNEIIQLKKLCSQIRVLEKETKSYMKKGLLSCSAEKFIEKCNKMKRSISHHLDCASRAKMKSLLNAIDDTEHLTSQVVEKTQSCALRDFLSACKDFKSDLGVAKKSGSICSICTTGPKTKDLSSPGKNKSSILMRSLSFESRSPCESHSPRSVKIRVRNDSPCSVCGEIDSTGSTRSGNSSVRTEDSLCSCCASHDQPSSDDVDTSEEENTCFLCSSSQITSKNPPCSMCQKKYTQMILTIPNSRKLTSSMSDSAILEKRPKQMSNN